MLSVKLTDLDRSGSVRVQREVSADHALLGGMEPELGGPVEVDLLVTATATGQVVARGMITAPLVQACRRCLERVVHDLEVDLAMVWAPPDELGNEEGGAADAEGREIRSLDLSDNELDLGLAVREELILAAPRYVLCEEDCRGLCPQCGINRNVDTCECTLAEPDPRWDALRKLKDE